MTILEEFDHPIFSKGHSAREEFNSPGGRKPKYDWETLTLENKLFIEIDSKVQRVLNSARQWAKKRSLKYKYRGELKKIDGKFVVVVWRIQ
jgi:hypothetical protein